MSVSSLQGDIYVNGTLQAKTLVPSPGSVANSHIAAGAAIDATKTIHQRTITYSQADGADVAAAIVPICTVHGATLTLVAVEVVCLDAPSGGDKTFTVDVLKANVGTPAPATILTTPRTYPNGTADCTVEAAAIASPALVDNDTLIVQVATSGSTGVQGQGLVVNLVVREDPQ